MVQLPLPLMLADGMLRLVARYASREPSGSRRVLTRIPRLLRLVENRVCRFWLASVFGDWRVYSLTSKCSIAGLANGVFCFGSVVPAWSSNEHGRGGCRRRRRLTQGRIISRRLRDIDTTTARGPKSLDSPDCAYICVCVYSTFNRNIVDPRAFDSELVCIEP